MPLPRVLIVLTSLFAVGCSAGSETPPPDPAGQAGQPSEQSAGNDAGSPTPQTAQADAEMDGTCRPKARATAEGTQELQANVTITNTGNIGVRVRVAATWPKPGATGISTYQRLRLEQGQSQDLRMRVVVGEEEAAAIEKAVNKDKVCRVKSRVVGAFGAPGD